MIYIGEKKEKNKNVGYGLGGRRKREFGGLFLEAGHTLELEVREKKKDSKKGIFFLRRRLLAR